MTAQRDSRKPSDDRRTPEPTARAHEAVVPLNEDTGETPTCVIIGVQDYPKQTASLTEVIEWAKKNRKLMEQSPMGRAVLAAIDKNDLRKLKKHWQGKR